jgi:hypothetical protein
VEAVTDKPLPKILISAVPDGTNPWLMASAVAEDGTILYEKTCSTAHWTRIDFGLVGPESAHSYHAFVAYKAHYPDGFTLCDCLDEKVCNPWPSEREALRRAIEMIEELRGYTRDWNWKYGTEWDAELAAIRRGLR